jgi:prolyl-tRNA editing enzyme YbaK/EbsC (Cys-tRNA(Pro) deacylase)
MAKKIVKKVETVKTEESKNKCEVTVNSQTVSSQDLFNALVILDKKINGILLVLDEMNKREEQKMNIGKSF